MDAPTGVIAPPLPPPILPPQQGSAGFDFPTGDKPGWTGTAATMPQSATLPDVQVTAPPPPDATTATGGGDQKPTAPDGSDAPKDKTAVDPTKVPPPPAATPPYNGPPPSDPFASSEHPEWKQWNEQAQAELAQARAAVAEYNKQLIDMYNSGKFNNERFQQITNEALEAERTAVQKYNQIAQNPPHRSTNDSLVAVGGLAMALGAVGGRLANPTSMMTAIGAATNAAVDRNDEMFKEAMTNWKDQAEMVGKGATYESKLQSDAIAAAANNTAMLYDKLKPLYTVFQNVQGLRDLEEGNYSKIIDREEKYRQAVQNWPLENLLAQAKLEAYYSVQSKDAQWQRENGGQAVPQEIHDQHLQEAIQTYQSEVTGLEGKGDSASMQNERLIQQRAKILEQDPTFEPLKPDATPQEKAKRASDAQIRAKSDFAGGQGGDLEAAKQFQIVDAQGQPVGQPRMLRERKNAAGYLDATTGEPVKLEPGQFLKPMTGGRTENASVPKAYTMVGPDGKSQGVNLSWLPQEKIWWDVDKNQPFVHPQGYQVVPAPAGGGRMASAQINSMVAAGNDTVKALENLTDLPATATSGWFMGADSHAGPDLAANFMHTLTHGFQPQEVQDMQVTFQGVQRAIATLEAQGRATGLVGLTTVASGLMPQKGDSRFTILRKYAEIRQIVETNLQAIANSGTINPTQAQFIDDVLNRVKEAYPYTVHDINDIERYGRDQKTVLDIGKRLKQQYEDAKTKADHPQGPTFDRDAYAAARQNGTLNPGDLYYIPGDSNPHRVPGGQGIVIPPNVQPDENGKFPQLPNEQPTDAPPP